SRPAGGGTGRAAAGRSAEPAPRASPSAPRRPSPTGTASQKTSRCLRRSQSSEGAPRLFGAGSGGVRGRPLDCGPLASQGRGSAIGVVPVGPSALESSVGEQGAPSSVIGG